MRWKLAALAFALCPAAAAGARAPLHDPVMLNIGFVCRWDMRCMERQERAMKRALAYVKKHRPPAWKVELCNRNAKRRHKRVDWIGFHNCIRNPAIRPYRSKRRG